MAKSRLRYVCQQCNTTATKWGGRCDNCGAWNSMIEEVMDAPGSVPAAVGIALKPTRLTDTPVDAVGNRLASGFEELDQLLGGGIVPGSVLLLAGQPGMGKSTLLLQVADHVAMKHRVLYVSGEESAGQVRLRAMRLGADSRQDLELISSTSADDIAATIAGGEYSFVVVDSMQTVSMAQVTSAPGTVSQITNSANAIIRAAKSTNTAVMLVGHVTKEGSIAGPKVLEHVVDVVLQFEGDRYGGFKLLRAAKNRFGSIHEVAIFDMEESGLVPVTNPSASLLAERQEADGSVVLATMEGSQPLLVEIQALVNSTHYGYPKRTSSGFDLNRLNVLIAVLEKRTKLSLSDKDVFVNVVGGLKLQDPAADLAICMAIASAATERRLPSGMVVFGEVGLGGEIRSASYSPRRIAEARKLGFDHAIAPYAKPDDGFVIPARDLRDALNQYLNKTGDIT